MHSSGGQTWHGHEIMQTRAKFETFGKETANAFGSTQSERHKLQESAPRFHGGGGNNMCGTYPVRRNPNRGLVAVRIWSCRENSGQICGDKRRYV